MNSLPAPGVAWAEQATRIYVVDPFVRSAVERGQPVSMALAGLGALAPSRLPARGSHYSSQKM
jgi:DNA-binding transcriptional regulator LsrR (DeoR family)